jgi:hypothetical protein
MIASLLANDHIALTSTLHIASRLFSVPMKSTAKKNSFNPRYVLKKRIE